MTQQEQHYGRLVWTGLRQMQALRDAVTWSLFGPIMFKPEGEAEFLRLDVDTVATWLEGQGLPAIEPNPSDPSLVGVVTLALDQYRWNLLGPDALRSELHGQRGRHQEVNDFGTERSSAGWHDAVNFCITSAFVRLLGAWEQFELDVLKSLIHYRPMAEALGPPEEQLPIEPDLSVVHEEPTPDNLLFCIPGDSGEEVVERLSRMSVSGELRRRFANEDVVLPEAPSVSPFDERKNGWVVRDQGQDFLVQRSDSGLTVFRGNQVSSKRLYRETRLWTWVRKQAENNVERRKILMTVFAIEPTPGEGKEKKANNTRRDQWYDQRNAIAHGRAKVTMTLAEYVEAEVFVYRAMTHVSEQCDAKHKLLV